MSKNLALWTGVLAGPIVWLLSFEAKFALAPWACTFQSEAALYSIAIAALILCAASAVLSWQEWRTLGSQSNNEAEDASARGNFMALGGIVLSAGFFIVVLAQWLPDLMLRACE
jgi:hypothetical protein